MPLLMGDRKKFQLLGIRGGALGNEKSVILSDEKRLNLNGPEKF